VPYKIELKKSAEKEYLNLEKNIKERVKVAIQNLSKDPKPSGFKKLQNRDGYRIRVGDYRIVYTIDESINLIEIFKIAHRKDVYR